MITKKLLLYYNTLKYLKSKQLAYNIVRRLIKTRRFIDATGVTNVKSSLIETIQYSNKIDHESVCFLNEKRSFSYISDWACVDESKLWRYNLHYFDFLLDPGAPEYIKDKLIDDWVRVSHSLNVDAWEPYPLSLRIVNWVKYFINYKNNTIPSAWLESLYQQAYVLSNSVEFHILANHYLKNAKGLLFAGSYLNCKHSRKWFSKGKNILLEEAEEQIMGDGGHYERSPMYHSIVTEDYLDVINLINANSLDFNAREITFLNNKITAALKYLNCLTMPDGDIPLFNDSSFNIAPHPDAIYDYAERVIGYKRVVDEDVQLVKSFDDSGYYVIRDGINMCVIDCGSVGPDYQPGHTHCDILSYELAIGGKRLIIDTGVFSYENNYDRQHSRMTSSHNTVSIDGKEQSEIWGSFRVARRASIYPATVARRDNAVFTGGYSPFWSKNSKIIHRRKIVYNYQGEWRFSDYIEGDGVHKIESYIHFHPDIDINRDENNYNLVRDGVVIAVLDIGGNVTGSVSKSYYYPEFGKRYKVNVIAMSVHVGLPTEMEYTIKSHLAS